MYDIFYKLKGLFNILSVDRNFLCIAVLRSSLFFMAKKSNQKIHLR